MSMTNIRFNGGNLEKLVRMALAPHIKNLQVNRGFSHGYVSHTLYKHIHFPVLRTLYLDWCDSNYLFYHANLDYFPNLTRVYLNTLSFDQQALKKLTRFPHLKTIYYTENTTIDDKFHRFQNLRSSPQLQKITSFDFTTSIEEKGDYTTIDDPESCYEPLPFT